MENVIQDEKNFLYESNLIVPVEALFAHLEAYSYKARRLSIARNITQEAYGN